MIAIPEILNQNIFGVTLGKIVMFFIIILFTFILKSVFLYVIDQKITALVKITKTEFDDLVLNAIKSPLSYLILRDISTFERLTGIKFEEKDRELIEKTTAKYPLFITPYCLSLIEYDERITGI
jgi:hypothetical protein